MPNRLLREGITTSDRTERQLQSVRLAYEKRRDRMRAAGPLPHSAVRDMLNAASGQPCPECGNAMARWCGRRVVSLDHIVAISKGGTNELSNLRAICNRCNARKGSR